MISLAITSFNRSDLVIESFIQVVDNDFIGEIVIVDDYSDNAIYIKLYNLINDLNSDKIKIHRNEANLGPFKNKYEAVKKCSNDWVILLDSDNIIDNSYIEIVEGLAKEDDIMYIPEILYKKKNKKNISWHYVAFSNLIIDKSNIKDYVDVSYFGAFLNTGNHFFNRNRYMQVIENACNDLSLSINDAIYFSYLWLLSGNRMKVVPDLYYIHRPSKDSWWVIHSKECMGSTFEIIRRIKEW